MSEYKFRTVNGKRRPEHRIVVEEVLGVKLAPNQVVHHINGDKGDNRIENLQVMDIAEHTRLHMANVSQSPEKLQRQRAMRKGKSFPQARRMTEEQVKTILYDFAEGRSVKSLAEEYGVSWTTIERICLGETYRDVYAALPKELFPLPEIKRKKKKSSNTARRFSPEEVTDIHLRILSGRSDRSIAEDYNVAPKVISNIREEKTYRDIPMPKAVAEYLDTLDMAKLADRMLEGPMPDLQDGFDTGAVDLAVLSGVQVDEILMKEYALYPNLHARLAYVMLCKALTGDHAMLFALFAVSSRYVEYVPQLIRKESQASLVLGG